MTSTICGYWCPQSWQASALCAGFFVQCVLCFMFLGHSTFPPLLTHTQISGPVYLSKWSNAYSNLPLMHSHTHSFPQQLNLFTMPKQEALLSWGSIWLAYIYMLLNAYPASETLSYPCNTNMCVNSCCPYSLFFHCGMLFQLLPTFTVFWRSWHQSLQSSGETNSPKHFLWTSEFWYWFDCLVPLKVGSSSQSLKGPHSPSVLLCVFP